MIRWWQLHFLGAEFGVAVAATTALAYLVHWTCFAACVDSVVAVSHPFIYASLASVCGSLLGFSLTAASIVLATVNSESLKLRKLRESGHYETIWRVFGASVRVLAATTVLALAGLVVDRTGLWAPPWAG